MHRHHHRSTIKFHHRRVLDPNPGPAESQQFRSFEEALSELRAALPHFMVMAQFRQLLIPQFMPALMTDEEVLRVIAYMVAQGRAAIRDQPGQAGDLPWPQILADLERFEGTVSHMYVDTKGYVTVGTGKMLPNAAEAQKLAFVVRATGAKATPDQIAADFAKVHAQAMGHLPSFYKSDLDLPSAEIDRITKEIAQHCDKEVAGLYKGYAKYPVEVRRALIDMRFNMGGNMDKFKNFKKDIEEAAQTGSGKDWEAAAKESYRRDVNADRNNWTSDMILKGGGVKK